MTKTKPAYVVRSGDPVHLQPYVCKKSLMYGFYINGNKQVMQERLIDPALNTPAGGKVRYEVVSGRVMVTFAVFTEGRCKTPPDSLIGSTVERSWTVWVSLIGKEPGDLIGRPLFYPAYICVDNSWSVAVGREVYGFPKNQGEVIVPARDAGPLALSASAIAMPRYDVNGEVGVWPLMRVEEVGLSPKADESWSDLDQAIGGIAAGWLDREGLSDNDSAEAKAQFITGLNPAAVPGVFLKQFRDAADGTKACYQAIVEAPSAVTKFRAGGLLRGQYEGWIADYDSHPLAKDLGILPGTVALSSAYWVDYDFEIGNGTVIWEA